MPTIGKNAKLSDVAKAAGVSQGTVSNVFNHPQIVREEVREHVRKVAQKLGYRGADPKGRLLRAGKVNAIGVATAEPLSYFFEDPFARVLMSGIAEVCDAEGAGVSLVSSKNTEDLSWNLSSALVDGFLLLCLEGGEQLIRETRERQLPFIALALGHLDDSIPAIGIDNYGGALAAGRHIGALGHQRIAVLALAVDNVRDFGPTTVEATEQGRFVATRDRLRGYFDGLKPFGVDTVRVPIFETQNNAATVIPALEALFTSLAPPTALLCQSDQIALLALDWLRARGLSVPDDVSLIGFDGVPEGAVSNPPLTTVAQPIAEIGRRAARRILDGRKDIVHEMLDVELVVRASTARPRP